MRRPAAEGGKGTLMSGAEEPVAGAILLDDVGPEFFATVDRKLKSKSVRVLLCGASLSGSVPKPDDFNRYLRYEIRRRLEEDGTRVVLGEDEQLYDALRKAARMEVGLADFELILAAYSVNLVVMFPCSPGSFAELGMFALAEQTAGRLIIVIDGREDHSGGFVTRGPVVQAKENGGRVRCLRYDDIDGIWDFVKETVNRERLRQVRNETLRPR